MKTGLQLKLAQHLTLTPQLQQSIRLLQLSTLELQQEISTALAENPLLELEDADEPPELSIETLAVIELESEREAKLDSDLWIAEAADPLSGVEALGLASDVAFDGVASPEPALSDLQPIGEEPAATTSTETSSAEEGGEASDRDALDLDEWGSGSASHDGDDLSEWQQSRNTSLQEHLLQQVPLLREGEFVNALLRVLIESLDDNGFLAISLEETALLAQTSVEALRDDWDHALSLLHTLEPAGVGARDIRECLLIQLQELKSSTATQLAYRIVKENFELLSQRDYVRIRKLFGVNEQIMRESLDVIQRLNPRPGAAFADIAASQMVPDVIVRRTKSRWTAELNQGVVPKLAVSAVYADMLHRQKEGRATPLSNQLQEARWLVKNVAQRFDTILRVANEIVERQQAFFEHGAVAMRPLVLREVADALGLHESTVSRVTTQKYLTSVRGTFEFKYFFGSHVATDAGGAASSTAIRAMIKTLVSEEETQNPLSDSRIAEMLGEQGIIVARRTVAKYREQQGIDPVNLRKR